MNNSFLETIKAFNGQVYNLSYHQERLKRVLDSLNIAKSYNLSALLAPPKDGLYRCRIVYDAQKIALSYIKYKKREVNSLKLIYDDTILYDKKYENRDALNEHFAKREDADEIIIVKNGLLTDTTIANIALYDGKRWLTPKTPLLEGTTRRRYLESGKIFEADIAVDGVQKYKKLALMNAMIDFDIIAEENIRNIIC